MGPLINTVAIGNSTLLFSVRFLLPLIQSAIATRQCRTCIVYYHNDSSAVANEFLQSLGQHRIPYVSFDFDDKRLFSSNVTIRTHVELGSRLCNIYVMKNLDATLQQHERTIRHFDRQSIHLYFMVIHGRAPSDDSISDFFQLIWTQYEILPAAAFFLDETIHVYTQFPYKQQFAVKIGELPLQNGTDMNQTLRRYFLGKADNLENAKVNAYMPENIPKAFRLPSRYRRRGGSFYFGGRDGYVAKHLESVLNVRWQYKTIDLANTKIINFGASTSNSSNLYGERVDYDDKCPSNLEYRTYDPRLPISNAYNDCEISFKPWRITTLNRKNNFKGFLPFEKDDSVIIVQNLVNEKTNLSKYVTITLSVLIVYLVCVIVRVIIRRVLSCAGHERGDKRIIRIVLNTWGALMLAYPNERIHNRTERVLYLFVVVFAMLLSMFASGVLLGNILAKETQTGMNTLKELAESNLPICISTELNQTRSEWSQGIDDRIDARIKVVSEKQLLESILDCDFTCVYVCSKMKATTLMNTPQVRRDGIPAFRFMKDILVPNLISYEIKTNSPLEARIKYVLQAFIEMGYFKECENWSFLLIRNFFRRNQTRGHNTHRDTTSSASLSSITFDKLFPYFIVYIVGIAVACVIFVGEIIHFKYKRRSIE